MLFCTLSLFNLQQIPRACHVKGINIWKSIQHKDSNWLKWLINISSICGQKRCHHKKCHASSCQNMNRLPCQSLGWEASPPDSRLSNSRSSGEDGEPPSPSDEGDGPSWSPSQNRPSLAPPRRPHQDVPSQRTVEPVSRKKSHWLISLFVFQYYFFAKSDLDLSIDFFSYLFCIFQIILLPNIMFYPIITTLDRGGGAWQE